MEMFGNLGKTLTLLRSLRDLSQAKLCRSAGVGKSQLSKYESARELPKLETLERVLLALDVAPLQFFYALSLVDQCEVNLEGNLQSPESLEMIRVLRPLSGSVDEAFARVFQEFLGLYRTTCEASLLGSPSVATIPQQPSAK